MTVAERAALKRAASHPLGNVVGMTADPKLCEKLVAAGWIEFSHRRYRDGGRGPVKIYRITDAGRAAVGFRIAGPA